ncbi:MAG TPA: FAD-dependent oxidoreductase, partial [Vicinamibacterales bacterium]|nr:FAD-dependent oxidoreductase [Vicinamibacterales bacterium]
MARRQLMDLRTGCAFWIVKNGLLASYPPLTSDSSADVVVIGAGITGALIADELTRAGACVVVLDRRDVASDSTAASTGLLQHETDASLEQLASMIGLEAAVRVYRLGLAAIDRIEQPCDEIEDPCGFARRPCLYVERLSSSELRSRFGLSFPGALYAPGDDEIDPFRFSHRLLLKASQGGSGARSDNGHECSIHPCRRRARDRR